MQLVWPSPQDYNEAVQNPHLAFVDSELQDGEPDVNQLGLPRPITGSFASVYKMICPAKNWAVRCFLKAVYDQELRYRRISEHLSGVELSSTVNFEYQPDGIKYRGRHLPIIKMEWVDGVTLENYINVSHDNGEVMLTLAEKFLQLYAELQAAGIAHGDLQHGNLMVTNNSLKLVDYDGMYVPSLKATSANELGHRNYQHPRRVSSDFGLYLDNFSAWVILISLYSLSLDNSLWDVLAGGEECLLFRQSDFRTPASSTAFSVLAQHKNSEINALAAFLSKLLNQPLQYIPPLDRQLFPKLTGEVNGNLAEYVVIAKLQSSQSISSRKQAVEIESGTNVGSAKNSTEQEFGLFVGMQNPDFINGNYAEAAAHYARLLSNLSTRMDVARDLKLQIECYMHLGYCNVFLGDMNQALGHFRNGLILAKSNNQIILAMRCMVCMAIAQCALGKMHVALEEIRQNFPGQSDLKAAIRMELSGPLAKNIALADFIYRLAVHIKSQGTSIARNFFDMALEAYTKSVGAKSLPVALCLQGRVASDIISSIKLSDEQDLSEARDIVIHLDGTSSQHLLPIQLDLIRVYVRSAIGFMQNNDDVEARTCLIKAISEVEKLPPQGFPLNDCKELLLKTMAILAGHQDDVVISNAFAAVTKLLPEKTELTKVFLECAYNRVDWGNSADAQLFLRKVFEELRSLPPGIFSEREINRLILGTLQVLANTNDQALAHSALRAFQGLGGLSEEHTLKLKSYLLGREADR